MSKEIEETQVKSKKRVKDHGEVFTNKREVNAMLDLVKQETERIGYKSYIFTKTVHFLL
jgi:hypothetical protein